MVTRLSAVVGAALALVGAVAVSAPRADAWQSFHLTARAYGTYGKCSHAATAASGGCQGLVESGSFEGHTFSGGVRWTWDHHAGSLEIVGNGFELRGSIPMHWTWFRVPAAAFGGRLFRSGTHEIDAGKPGGVLHLTLVSHSAFDGKSGTKAPGYTLRLAGFLEAF